MAVEHDYPKRKTWRGSVSILGRRRRVSLGIEIPRDPREDRNWLCDDLKSSHAKAEGRLEELESALSGATDLALANRIFREHRERWNPKAAERRKGSKQELLRIAELEAAWKAKRVGEVSDRHLKVMARYVADFAAYMKQHHPGVAFCDEIEPRHAQDYMKSVWAANNAPATYNKKASGLGTVFRDLEERIGFTRNPFDKIEWKSPQTVHHEPFDAEQVKAILELAESDHFCGPLAIIGLATGLRLGDVASLQWDNVDLERGVINVNCRKTGEPAWIPIFKFFRDWLEAQPTQLGAVLPEQARMHAAREGALSDRFGRFLEKVAQKLKGTRSSFVKTQVRARGVRKAAKFGYGSFRTTWVTTATLAGVDLKLIRLVTAHVSEAMVRRFYFRAKEQQKIKVLKDAFAPLLGESRCSGPAPEGGDQPGPPRVVGRVLDAATAAKLIAFAESMTEANWSVNRDMIVLALKPFAEAKADDEDGEDFDVDQRDLPSADRTIFCGPYSKCGRSEATSSPSP